MKDELGDRLKELENSSTIYHDIDKPIYMRLDGRSFSKVTRKMERPFSVNFINLMQRITTDIMEEFSPDIAFHQSDEISLAFLPKKTPGFSYPFGGRQNKLLSVIASQATQSFIRLYPVFFDDEPLIHNINFDARSMTLSIEDTALAFLWRHKDATRNAINQYAHGMGYKNTLHGLKTHEILEMFIVDGIKWEEVYPNFKYGTFFTWNKEVKYKESGEEYSRRVLKENTLDRSYNFVYDYMMNRI